MTAGPAPPELHVVIPGEPVGKGRPRFVPAKDGRKARTITPEQTRTFETRARYVARAAASRQGWAFADTDRFEVEVLAFRTHRDKGPDLDNVIKAVLDALNEIAWKDDAHVRELAAQVVQAGPGTAPRVSVRVRKLLPDDPPPRRAGCAKVTRGLRGVGVRAGDPTRGSASTCAESARRYAFDAQGMASWGSWHVEVVPMTTALLLRDAEAALTRVAQDNDVTALEAAFLCWLRGDAQPGKVAQTFASPLRDYSDVALAALGEVAGWNIDATRLEDGLRWLVDVALDRVGVPAPVVTDGLAHVCLGLAARERPWLAAWHDQVLARAADTIQPTWLAGGGRVVRGQESVCAPELRVALASRGAATSTDAEANAVLEGLLKGELPDDAFHAQVLLAALAWTRRAAPVALPSQATPETVARLLAEAPRALQQWPWEDKPKTPKSRAAKWHIDNE